mmetsp:Transcript_15004/g.44733  ORF Transcript_15004/g.44733 Transcript_15004/m.44733 type:complete len:388 (+) Transcript_15004:46-1209(+)
MRVRLRSACCLIVLAAKARPTAALRHFRCVPYGERAPAGGATITCDGRVPGATLELTHWTDNETPDDLYADTSTECALRLARIRRVGGTAYADHDDALVINNHFDTDGVLSAYACLHPEAALRHASLLADGAAAGDFGEWSSDAGVRLDAAIEAIGGAHGGDPAAYDAALAALPALLASLEADSADAADEEAPWRDGWGAALAGWQALASGDASLSRAGAIAVLREPSPKEEAESSEPLPGAGKRSPGECPRLPAVALHRGLTQLLGAPFGIRRVLRATDGGARGWRYEYETPGHGWVKRLVTREPVAAPEGGALAESLTALGGVGTWRKGGGGGLISLCASDGWVDAPPDAVCEALLACDEAAQEYVVRPGSCPAQCGAVESWVES